jgi:hypothetical protein
MNVLTIATGYDSPGKKDATGAFLPEAKAFAELYGGAYLRLAKLSSTARRATVENTISEIEQIDVIAVFGHGTSTSLIATGHTIRHVYDLAGVINAAANSAPSPLSKSKRPLSIILYACSTGFGKTGFADLLADQLAMQAPGVNVWAHSTAGHTSWNPYVELAGGPNGGDPIARPGDQLWKRWRERLHDNQAFRLSFWQPAHGLDRSAALKAVRGSI